MKICKLETCTGCAACVNVCPVSAIIMKADEKGFLYPSIDSEKCISCGKCVRCCPQNIPLKSFFNPKVYAAKSKNKGVRRKSSSGGIFSLLAERTLENGGVVFGAAYSENLSVKHIAVSKKEDLCRLRGSKYIQSEIGDSYQRVKELLCNAQPVLFSGTPCQVAGLKAYLGKEYEELLTIDILCHGVPSPAVFRKYIEHLEELMGDKLCDYQFRDKLFGWKNFNSKVQTKNGKMYILVQDPYMDGFLKNVFLRDSCYHCNYASENRVGDITLGDYWGYQERFPDYLLDDDGGMSLVLINNDKGFRAYRAIKKQLLATKRCIADAKRQNQVLYTPFEKPSQTQVFWAYFNKENWEQLSGRMAMDLLEFTEIQSTDEKQFQKNNWLRQLKHTIKGCTRALINKLRRK